MYKVSCNIVFFVGKPFGSPDTKKSQILVGPGQPTRNKDCVFRTRLFIQLSSDHEYYKVVGKAQITKRGI